MAICKLTYPQDSNVLESKTDFLELADPTKSFSSVDLRTVNLLNNVLLKSMANTGELEERYPALNTRYAQNAITDQEFADFLLDNGMAIEFVQQTFVNDFPVEVDISLIRQITESLVEDDERKNVVGVNKPENIETILTLQNAYYAGAFSSSFNPSLCANFSNPFGGLIPLLASAKDLAEGIKGLAKDINKLIRDIQYKSLSGLIQDLTSKLEKFQEQLIKQIDSIKDQLLQKVTGIADKAARLFKQLPTMPAQAYKFIKRKINQVRKFFSEENMKSLKEKVRGLFNANTSQFDDLLPNVLNFFLLKGCGLSGLVEGLMNEPVDRVQSLVDNYATTHSAIAGYSTETRNQIREKGGLRINPQTKNKSKMDATIKYNRANPSAQLPTDITQEERSLLDQIDENGLSGYFKFVSGRNVKEMGLYSQNLFEQNKTNPTHQQYYDESQNYHMTIEGEVVDAGWGKVKPGVWIRIIRAIRAARTNGQLSGEITILSAYRSPYYNRLVARGAQRSKHMYGEALDISYGNLSYDDGIELIRQASRFGFGGISYYPNMSFTHFDVGARRTWGENGKYAAIINSHLA